MKNTLAALLLMAAGTAFAQASPVGLWKTIDDKTKAEKSHVRLAEEGGALVGRIEKLLDPTKQDTKCDKCTGERKDQPVLGMTIVSNVRQNADDKGLWDGGEILDPNDGKVYKVRLKPVDGGRKLEVRGYVGAPLLGRTQTWMRVE